MRPLVLVDWGTSSLRVARASGSGWDERSADQGILKVAPGAFEAVLRQLCGDWLDAPNSLCLMSGMVGSRQGWKEAPYCACPGGFSELAQRLSWVLPGRIAVVPGMSCEHDGVPDVMRGEEVQVFGALAQLGLHSATVVLPGTHSKWVQVRDGRIVDFQTFMTGEFYALLRQHSILARTMAAEDGELDRPAFEQGVQHALGSRSLLGSAFSARTLALFDRLGPNASPSYLSGLVIGEELRAQAPHSGPVVLMGSPTLTPRYQHALALRGLSAQAAPAQATWHGLTALARFL